MTSAQELRVAGWNKSDFVKVRVLCIACIGTVGDRFTQRDDDVQMHNTCITVL